VAQQCQTYGISLWIPYYGSGMTAGDRYWFRSCIFPASRIGWDARDKNLDYALLRRMIAEFRQVAPYLLGDFWPLAPYSLAGDVWMAWQFDRPERGEGMVQAFRRAGSPVASSRLKLRGLVPEARYRLTNLDEPVPIELGGRELMERGLPVTIAGRPGAIIVVYRQVVGRQQVHRFRADRGDPFVHLPGEAVEPLKAYSELAGRRRTSSTP
jgi:alpha-galactosidase